MAEKIATVISAKNASPQPPLEINSNTHGGVSLVGKGLNIQPGLLNPQFVSMSEWYEDGPGDEAMHIHEYEEQAKERQQFIRRTSFVSENDK